MVIICKGFIMNLTLIFNMIFECIVIIIVVEEQLLILNYVNPTSIIVVNSYYWQKFWSLIFTIYNFDYRFIGNLWCWSSKLDMIVIPFDFDTIYLYFSSSHI
jgi:hypothetical protein